MVEGDHIHPTPDAEPDDEQRDQLLWELEVLRSRVTELEEQLKRVTRQRDAALATLGASHPVAQPDETPRDVAHQSWQPTNACRYCDGEGVIWVHDFRMDCKRCGGSGVENSAS